MLVCIKSGQHFLVMTVQEYLVVFRRGRKAIIHSVKHVVDVEGTLTGGSKSVAPLLNTVAVLPSPFNPNVVQTGETVNAMFITVYAIGSAAGGLTGAINWFIWKLHEGQVSVEPTPGSTGDSMVRNQIFHEEKGLSGSEDGTPMVFKGVIMIPKGMRRMREGDEIRLVLNTTQPVDDVLFCVKAIYKSFS